MSTPDRLTVDRLAHGGAIEVRLLDNFVVGDGPIRTPHRHDYHELMWLRSGSGEQIVDGEVLPITPGTVTVIARGQVHQFRRARGLGGALLRITDAALTAPPGWLLGGRGGRVIAVPPTERARFEATLAALHAETVRPPDPFAPDLIAHLTATVLLWLERWHDASRAERPQADDADVALHRRFLEVLEKDYNKHHDVAHYADALAVPPAALARALSALTGRGTKELIVE